MTASVRDDPKGNHVFPGVNAKASIVGYCYQHDLHPDLIPVPSRQVDEWARLAKVKEVVEDLPKYQLCFRRGHHLEGRHTGDTHLTCTYLWMTGAFPTHQPQAGRNWYNPNYAHGPEHAEKMHPRDYHIMNAIELPTVTAKEVAARFGQDRNTIQKYMSRNNLHFRKRQLHSKRRIARSILTSAKWEAYDVRELCERIPNRPWSTVKDWVYTYAKQNEWQAPDPPEWTKWYR